MSDVQSWRRYTILGVLAFLVGVGVWASAAHWTDTVNVELPKGQPPQSVSFACGKLFSSPSPQSEQSVHVVKGFNPLAHLGHRPCSGRTERRLLVVVDGVVGLAALFVLLTRFSPRPIEPATA